MHDMATSGDDSGRMVAGWIPGLPDHPAFVIEAPEPSEIPVLIAVPHAGRAYPPCLIDRMRNPGFAALRLEDRYADLLAREVARVTGAALLVAHAPRAMIDLNRAPEDVDWDMFNRGAGRPVGSYTPGLRARAGLGLIPRRIPGLGELWKRRHDHAELEARLAGIHVPYHAQLAAELGRLRGRWGAALLIDVHSMPPLPPVNGLRGAEFVIGDRFGASSDGRLVAHSFAHLAESNRLAAHNRPYAGGYVLDRHAAPSLGVHAIQIEVDRSSYLDERLAEPGAGLGEVAALLAGLIRRLAAEVVGIARQDLATGWAEAAE